MFEMRMTVVVVVVPAIYSYAIFGDKNYSSAQIIHIIPFGVDVKMLTDAYLCLLMLSVIFISRSLSIFILSTKHFYAYKND